MGTQIHPTAIVDSAAKLGTDVEVGPYSIVGPNVQVGDRCIIKAHVVIEGHTTLGEECRIWQFASIGSAPQDLKYNNEPSTLIIGKRNIMREYVTLQPGTKGGHMTTTIGDNNLFMGSSHVGHDCAVGNNNIFANSCGLAGHVTIMNNVILGGMVGIHQFTRIGDNVMLSAGSKVGADVPPFCMAQGDRAHLRGLNLIGLQRAGFSEGAIRNLKRAYSHLFGSVGNAIKRIETMPDEIERDDLVNRMLDFLASSTDRGICQPAKSTSA
ncbi:MAG: acyl-ACP--UDP-N-acetylglucosamine O-acyltransferase [Bdellovibrionales bacterium]|nr:acyl-ACP--UDP-N-acetylglucosamine O-acyltransferase [Bdellovibrionales bacterium]